MKIIHCTGDSLTFGSRDEYARSYPAELLTLIMKNKRLSNKYSVINSSINGGTSSDLLKRFMNSFTYNQNNEIIIILIGSNDTSQNIPKKVFNKNIENIFYITSKLYNRVFFCEIPKMSGIGLINYPENANQMIEGYNKELKNLSMKLKFKIIKFDKKLIDHLVDTVHYKNSGNILIANNIYNFLTKQKLIK